jgi:hypothetical protein
MITAHHQGERPRVGSTKRAHAKARTAWDFDLDDVMAHVNERADFVDGEKCRTRGIAHADNAAGRIAP